MARFLKIPQYFGQASDILFYSSKCQYESIEYYKKIKKINGEQVLSVNGNEDYLLARFDNKSGWFPQVGSTFFMKFMLPKDSPMYSKNFGIFGSGDTADMENKDFWGLSVRTDPLSSTKIFYLTVSNLLQVEDIPFRGFSFSPLTLPPEQFNTIALIQNSTYAQLYANGQLVARVNLTIDPETNNVYKKFYIGRYGNTNEYAGIEAYIKEVGLWERPIEERDAYDLHYQNLVENKGVTNKSKRIKIEAGKFYYDGYIHSIDETSIYIDGVGTESIYILISEQLVTEDEDSDLYDNSANTYNLGKPGMHRIKYTYSYGLNIDTANLKEGTYAIKFLEYVDGVKTFSLLDSSNDAQNTVDTVSQVTDTVSETGGRKLSSPSNTSDILNILSKYFYETVGNFLLTGLSVSVVNKDLETYQVSVGNGVYYLNGNRYELSTSLYLDVAKNSSMTTQVNEYIRVGALSNNEDLGQEISSPILLSQQPVVANYVSGGVLMSGVTRCLIPTVQEKTINVVRTDPNGEDIVDASALKVLSVYKGNTIYTPCSSIDSKDGDYYFYNGRIKWSPYSDNKPSVGSNGASVDSYKVKYTKYYACEEGMDKDFVLIKGDRIQTDIIEYKGRNITHALKFDMEHLIRARVRKTTGSTIILSASNFEFSTNTFKITDELNGVISTGDTIILDYSYNSSQNAAAQWHILFFSNGKDIDNTAEGLIDYKYYLTDIYTLAIDNDNVFRLYRGTPGYRGNAVRASVPDTSLPIADILIDPDSANDCRITPYNIYRMQAVDQRNLLKKVNEMENNIVLSELEKSGEAKASINGLKGMYVDSLSSYARTSSMYFDAYINPIYERLYSGFDKTVVQLEAQNTTNITLGREVYFPVIINRNTIVDSQKSNTGDDVINKIMQSEVRPQVEIYNDFSYDQEYSDIYTKSALNSIKLSPYALIPYNSETSVLNNSFANENTTSDRSTLIKKALEKFNTFFEDTGLNTVLDSRTVLFVGRGFNASEKNIMVKINNKVLDPSTFQSLSVDTSVSNSSIVTINDGNFTKKIKITPLTFAAGWSTDMTYGIGCNDYGEFVVAINIPKSLNLITGMQDITFSRYADANEPVNITANFSGILDSLRNVINTGSRGNITFYDCQKYSSDFIPGIIQRINNVTATILGIKLGFSYIDYSMPIAIDLYELDGSTIKNVVYRKFITSVKSFSNISGQEYTVLFDYPVNISKSKSYGIGICTENSSIKCLVTEIGKPSKAKEDPNVIVSKVNPMYTIVSVSNGIYSVNNSGKKGLVYELIALDNSASPKNTYGYTENTVRYKTVEFDKAQDRFYLTCDIDPTIGFDRKISVEYSIDAADVDDDSKTWYKITPYCLVTPPSKFTSITLRFIVSSGNDNYVSCVPQYPVLNTYKFKTDSSYYSQYFETGIEDNSGESNVNIYLETEYRAGSDYSVYVSPDLGATWRKCTLYDSKITGQTSYMVLKEEQYRYEARLNPPVVLGHEIITPSAGDINAGAFNEGMTASYLVALVDSNGDTLNPNEVYNIDASLGVPTIYPVNIITADQQKINLRIQIDANAAGFRIYRSLNGSATYSQIYSSIAKTYIPSSVDLTSETYGNFRIPVTDASEFPTKGILKINNELILYDGIEGNNLFLVKQRGYYNTTQSVIRNGDRVDLFDYVKDHATVNKGQIPSVNNDEQSFIFTDDNKTYQVYDGRTAKAIEYRGDNDTISYPSMIAIRIRFNNTDEITESSSLWNMICNIEKP